MKKIVFAFICAICVFSLLFTGCLFEDPANHTDAAGNEIVTDEQGQTVVVEATMNPALFDNDIAQFDLFGSDCFYFSGVMTTYSTGESTLMEIAKKDGNSYMGSVMEGIEIGFMKVGNEYYMVYPAGECALLLDEAVRATMDLDPSEMNVDTSALSFGEVAEALLVNTADVLVDTTLATCRTYQQTNGNFVKTYISDGKIIRLQSENANGVVESVLDIDVLTDVVPADKSTIPAGYKVYSGNTGMMSFMFKFASAVGFDAIGE